MDIRKRTNKTPWPVAMILLEVGTLLSVTGGAAAQFCEYEATVIRYPLECAFGEVQTLVNGLNDGGWIVGTYWCPIWPDKRPFYRTPEGDYVDFGLVAGSYEVVPADINNTGQICGYAQMSSKGPRGFIYEIATGEWTIIESVDLEIGRSYATAINDAGQVCGERTLGPWVSPRSAFLRNAKGDILDMGVSTTIGLDINAEGVVVGRYATTIDLGGEAFIWDGANVTWLGPVPNGMTSGASGINDLGTVTTTGLPDHEGSRSESFLWDADFMHQVPLLPGYVGVTVSDINIQSQVTGRCFEPDLNLETAILWQAGTTYPLDSIVTNPEVGSLESSLAINRDGEILVEGHDSANNIIGFLIQPLDSSPADADGDCDSDVWDLLRLLQDWGQSVSPTDFDGSGAVDVSDLLLLLANWG